MKNIKDSQLFRGFSVGKGLIRAAKHLANDTLSTISEDYNIPNITPAKVKAYTELAKHMSELKGPFMKLGQMLTLTGDILLPKEITSIFKNLQSNSEPMPKADVIKMLKKAYGKEYLKHFDDFDFIPMAAASIGQVHKAKLKNGKWVAIKIQYPNIEKKIKSDIKNLDLLKNLLLTLIDKKINLDMMINELKTSMLLECDYLIELRNQRTFKEMYSDFSYLYIPSVYAEFSTKHILVSEFVSGDTFDQALNYNQEIKNILAEELFELHLAGLFHFNQLHTDPQDGNYLFNQEKIFLFDFGSIKSFSKEFIKHYSLLCYSVRTDDLDLFKFSAEYLNIIDTSYSESTIQSYFELAGSILKPFLNTKKSKLPIDNPALNVFKTLSKVKGTKSPDPHFLLLDRANLGVFSKIKRLDASVDWNFLIDKWQAPVENTYYKQYKGS